MTMREISYPGLADWQVKQMFETVRRALLTLPDFRLYEELLAAREVQNRPRRKRAVSRKG
jgi:hypothetical protein